MVAYALVDVSYFPLAEVTTQSWQALHARAKALAKGRGAPDAEEARLIRELERVRIWEKVGEPSMVAYIERTFGYGPRCAFDRLRVARALGELPLIDKALSDGELFYSLVRELTRVATRETEEDWLGKAKGKSLREVERMVSGRKHGDKPEAPSKPENIRHVLTHEVSAATHALLREARKVLQEQVGERLDDDAFLAALARGALSPSETKSATHRMAGMKCEDCKRAWQDASGAVIELPKEDIEHIECHAERMDEHGKVTRYIPEATRRRVLARDHHRCCVPWCRAAHHLEPHHIEHFAQGGKSDDDNLITLCWHHHAALHRGKLRLMMENGEARFSRIEPLPAPANETRARSITETVIGALVGMGFKKFEAQSFVEAASAHVGTDATVAELLREALRRSQRLRA